MANSTNYVSQFTGDELDFAISSALGDKYRGNLSPGCHTIGASTDMQVDFNDLAIPGKYTAYFYIHGPSSLIGVSPICIQVFWGAAMLYQTIQVGSRLFWRDLLSGNLDWKEVDLGVEAATIIDNLVTDLISNEDAAKMALSANMGAELRKRMENLQIGNTNLIDFSNVFDDYFHSVSDRWSHFNGTVEDKLLSECVENSFNHRFPQVDDVDRSMVTMFTLKGSGVFGFMTGENNKNPVQVANQSMYTASVYILYQDSYIDYDANTSDTLIGVNGHPFKFTKENSPKIYIKLVNGDTVLQSKETTLYDLFAAPVESRTYTKGDKDQGVEDKVETTLTPSIGKTNGYVRLTVTYTATASSDSIGLQFGMDNADSDVVAEFVYPKIEYGQYATQYNHSWQDLYYFFNNCEEIYGRRINVIDPGDHNTIPEQAGLVFNKTTEEFDVEPIAVGGGGGFIKADPSTADSNTRKDQIIIFDSGNGRPGNADYRIRGLKAFINGAWSTLCNSPLTVSGSQSDSHEPLAVIQKDCAWLDDSNETDVDPAIINYLDEKRKRWRPAGAIATQVWFMQLDTPTDPTLRKLIWIKSDTRAPHIYDPTRQKWVPLLAVWGTPNT